MLRHANKHINLKESYSKDKNTRCKLTNSFEESIKLSLSRIASFYSNLSPSTIFWISVHQLLCLPVFPGPNELPSCRLAMEKQRAPARATQMEMDRKGKDWMYEAVETDEKNPLIRNVRLRFEASQSNPASTPQSTWHNLGSKRTCGNNL